MTTQNLPSTPGAVFASLMKQLAEAGKAPLAVPASPSTPEALAVALFELAARTGAALFSVWAAEDSVDTGDDDEAQAPATQVNAGISFFFTAEDSQDRVPVRQPFDYALYRPLGQALAAHAKRGADPKLPLRGSVSFPEGSADPDLELRVSFRDDALGTWTTAFARDREARQAYPRITRLPLPADAAAFLEAHFQKLAPVLFSGQVVLLTGAPRTGRSTTLRALMDAIPDTVHALAAVEDPKRGAGGAIGLVRAGQGMTLTQLVRSFLRQDPDLIFADEARTLEDMQILCNGALTGHATICVLEAKTPEDGHAWLTEALPDIPMMPLIVHHTRDPGTGAFSMSLHEVKPRVDNSALHVVPWTPPA